MKKVLSMLLAAAMIVGTIGATPVSAEELTENRSEIEVSTTAFEASDEATEDEGDSEIASDSNASEEEAGEIATESETVSDEESLEGTETDTEAETETVTESVVDELIKEPIGSDKTEMLGAGEIVVYLDDTADDVNNSKTIQDSAADTEHDWSYDADTATLTLEGTFDGEYVEASGSITVVMKDGAQFHARNEEGPVIISKGNTLTLQLDGTGYIYMAPEKTRGIVASQNIVVEKAEGAESGKLIVDHSGATADQSYLINYYDALTIEDATVEMTGTFDDSAESYAIMYGTASDVKLKGSGSLKIDLNVGARRAVGVGRIITFSSSGSVDITVNSTHTGSRVIDYTIDLAEGTGTFSAIGIGCPFTNNGAYPASVFAISPEMGKITLQGTWLPAIYDWLPYNKSVTNSEATGGVISAVMDKTLNTRVMKKADGSNLDKIVIETAATLPVPINVTESTYLDYPEAIVGVTYPRNNGLVDQLDYAVTGGLTCEDDDYYFSLKDGSTLPEGLSLNSYSGIISGTPLEEAEAGSVTIEVKVRDKNGNTVASAGTGEVTINYGAITEPARNIYVGDTTPHSMKEDFSGDGYEFDAETATLTLRQYTGGPVYAEKDLTVVLDGANKIHAGDEYALKSDGNLTIRLKGKSLIFMDSGTSQGIAASQKIVLEKVEGATSGALVIDHTGATAASSSIMSYNSTLTIKDVSVEVTGSFADTAPSYAIMYGADRDVKLEGSGSLKIDLNTGARRAVGVGRAITFSSSGSVDITVNSTHTGSRVIDYTIDLDEGTGTFSAKGIGCPFTNNGAYPAYVSAISPAMGKITLQGTWLPPIYDWLPYNKTVTNSEALGGVISSVWDETLDTRVMKKADGSNLGTIVIETASLLPVPMKVTDSSYLDYPEATVGETYPRNKGQIDGLDYAVTGGLTCEDDEYYFSLKDGSTLPEGLNLNAYSGKISGTPTKETPAGSVTIQVQVKDKDGNIVTSAGTREVTIGYGAITIPIVVTGVSVDPTEKKLEPDETVTITATPEPESAAAASVSWSSNHTDIATVTASSEDNKQAVVKAVKPGKATITAKTLQGNHTAACTVTVLEATPDAELSVLDGALFLTGLVSGTDYLVGPDGSPTTFTADTNGKIEIPASMYNKTIDIIRVNPDSTYNSKPQSLEVSVTLPETIKAVFENTPVAEGNAPDKDAVTVDSIFLTCTDLSWTPAPTGGKFVSGEAYTATMTFKTAGDLAYTNKPAVTINGVPVSVTDVSLGADGKTITAAYTYPETSSTVAVTGVELTPDPVIMKEGGFAVATTVQVLPGNASNKSYSLATGDDKVAYIQGNDVCPAAAGKTTITVTTEEGTFTDTSDVYVRYSIPDASQDIDVLKGLVPGATYLITPDGKEAGTAKAEPDGTISMRTDWYDTYLTIVRKHAEYEQCDSEAQGLRTGEAPEIPTDGMYIMFEDDPAEYVYTGAAIKPNILVYNNGVQVEEGGAYTVKYSNNTNVKRDKKGNVIANAKVTVTGKGNLSGSKSLTFKILPKEMTSGDIHVAGVRVNKGSKAKPVITFGNRLLSTKDYTQENASRKYNESDYMKITGKGNFTGSIDVMVTVVEKSELHSIKADLTASSIVYDPYRTAEETKALMAGALTIYDGADKAKAALASDSYEIIYPTDIENVGKKTLTIIGKNGYAGSVTKKITVKPLAVKEASGNGEITTNAQTIKDNSATDPYEYMISGVTLKGKLEVRYKKTDSDPFKELKEGTDYKVAYSNNKAVSTDTRKATYTITFIGNYKGTPALKNAKKTKSKPAVDVYTFSIKGASIAKEGNAPADNVTVNMPDIAYGKKADLYKSAPIVTVDGSIISNKNYTVKYYSDSAHTTEINKNNKINITNPGDEVTVYAAITGKGNYSGVIYDEYKVRRSADTVYDFSKAKVTLYQKGYPGKKKVLKSVTYTGKPRMVESTDIDGTIVVEYKLDGRKYTTLTRGVDYDVIYLSNTNKGKATILIVGRDSSERKFTGTKKTGFTIGAFNIKNSK